MSKVAFLGGGSFGTALAILLANKGKDVSIYDRDIDVVNDINGSPCLFGQQNCPPKYCSPSRANERYRFVFENAGDLEGQSS